MPTSGMSIDVLDWGPDFLHFMDESGQSPPTELQSWLTSNFETDRERLLGAFILVATGCWERREKDADIARRVVDSLEIIHSVREPEESARVEELLASEFRTITEKPDVDSQKDWIHNHRYQWLNTRGGPSEMATDVGRTLDSLSDTISDYDDLGAFVNDRVDSEKDPFYAIFDTITDVYAYPRLPTFDFLELGYRAGRIDGLYPRKPRYEYLSSNKPQPGLYLVIAGDAKDDPNDAKNMRESEVLDYLEGDVSLLDEIASVLYEAAVKDLGWKSTTAFFDVESCLCNYSKPVNKEYWKRTDG